MTINKTKKFLKIKYIILTKLTFYLWRATAHRICEYRKLANMEMTHGDLPAWTDSPCHSHSKTLSRGQGGPLISLGPSGWPGADIRSFEN